jgi:type III secretory pathway component EscV
MGTLCANYRLAMIVGMCLALVPARSSGGAEPEAARSNATADSAPASPRPVSVDEARRQAELLHESMHATLQIVHQQYFREDEGIVIPAITLKRVFRELARRQQVELRWLAVNAQAMNVDHEPRDAFEKQAATAIAAGADHFEAVEGSVYRRVGAITLESECLKCHLPTRTSVAERAAGLLISVPVKVE